MIDLLIIQSGALSELVLAMQVAASLKAQVEDLRTSWVVREMFAPIARACDSVDRVFIFERNAGAKGFIRLTKELRKAKFDYVFDMQGLLRTGLMTSRTIADHKVGRSDAREWSGMFYDEKVPLPPHGNRSHALEILLQFCPVLGAKPELHGTIGFGESERFRLRFAQGRGGARPILMFPDSRRADKCWGGFKQLTELIVREDPRLKVIWAGNNHVNDRGAYPASQFVNLTGNTSLVSLPALIKRADWVIANESGPMHLAAALGVRVLAIFGPTDPAMHGPYPLRSPDHVVVQAPVGDLRMLSAKDVYSRFVRVRARPALRRS